MFQIVAEISYVVQEQSELRRVLLATRIPESFEGATFTSSAQASMEAQRRNRQQNQHGVLAGTYDLATGKYVAPFGSGDHRRGLVDGWQEWRVVEMNEAVC